MLADLRGVGLRLLDLGQPQLHMAVDVAIGERRLGHCLGEQLESAIQMRCGHVEDGLQPGQRKIDSEACALGFQKLGELVSVVSLRALVQRSGADGRHALDVATLRH